MNPTVLVLADDLFWKTKIDHTLKSAQATGIFIEKSAQLAAKAESGRVGLVIVDLALRDDPFAAIAALKKNPKTKGIAVVGYYEHVQEGPPREGREGRLRPGPAPLGVLAAPRRHRDEVRAARRRARGRGREGAAGGVGA